MQADNFKCLAVNQKSYWIFTISTCYIETIIAYTVLTCGSAGVWLKVTPINLTTHCASSSGTATPTRCYPVRQTVYKNTAKIRHTTSGQTNVFISIKKKQSLKKKLNIFTGKIFQNLLLWIKYSRCGLLLYKFIFKYKLSKCEYITCEKEEE